MQSVLARANFENADLSDALMDRAVIVEANLRGAVLQVGGARIMERLPLSASGCRWCGTNSAVVASTHGKL